MIGRVSTIIDGLSIVDVEGIKLLADLGAHVIAVYPNVGDAAFDQDQIAQLKSLVDRFKTAKISQVVTP